MYERARKKKRRTQRSQTFRQAVHNFTALILFIIRQDCSVRLSAVLLKKASLFFGFVRHYKLFFFSMAWLKASIKWSSRELEFLDCLHSEKEQSAYDALILARRACSSFFFFFFLQSNIALRFKCNTCSRIHGLGYQQNMAFPTFSQ